MEVTALLGLFRIGAVPLFDPPPDGAWLPPGPGAFEPRRVGGVKDSGRQVAVSGPVLGPF